MATGATDGAAPAAPAQKASPFKLPGAAPAPGAPASPSAFSFQPGGAPAAAPAPGAPAAPPVFSFQPGAAKTGAASFGYGKISGNPYRAGKFDDLLKPRVTADAAPAAPDPSAPAPSAAATRAPGDDASPWSDPAAKRKLLLDAIGSDGIDGVAMELVWTKDMFSEI
jgi:hypothetical protein